MTDLFTEFNAELDNQKISYLFSIFMAKHDSLISFIFYFDLNASTSSLLCFDFQ